MTCIHTLRAAITRDAANGQPTGLRPRMAIPSQIVPSGPVPITETGPTPDGAPSITPDLTARGSFFLDAQYTPKSLFAGFLLKKGDIYPVHSLSTSERPVYGTGGTVIGDAAATAALLARYQRVFSQAMHTFKPGAWSRAKLAWDSKHVVADTHHVAMLARLWHPQGLSTEQKLALALTWENQTGMLATQKDDRRLNPKQAQQWEHWALHARTYLQLSGANDDAKGAALVEALAGCPAPKQKGDSEMKLPELGFSLEVSS